MEQKIDFKISADDKETIEKTINKWRSIDTEGSKKVISKKTSFHSITPPYTLLKSSADQYYILASTKKNPYLFLKRGSEARVKECIAVKIQQGFFNYSIEPYRIKIFFKFKYDDIALDKECYFFKKVHGFCELINFNDKRYLIMPHIPGERIGDLDYLKMNYQELKIMFIAAMKSVNQLSELKVLHKDLHADNFLYDQSKRKASIIDFGRSTHLNPDESFDFDDRFEDALIFYAIKSYAKFHPTQLDLMEDFSEKKLKMQEMAHQLIELANDFLCGKKIAEDEEQTTEQLDKMLDQVLGSLKKPGKEITSSMSEQILVNLLNKAIAQNDTQLINSILDLVKPSTLNNYPDEEGRHPIHVAFKYRNYDLLELLLNKGADINLQKKNDRKNTLFHSVVKKHDRSNFDCIKVTKFFIDKNASTDIKNYRGITVRKLVDKSDNDGLKNLIANYKL